jgi:glutathione S-transferase
MYQLYIANKNYSSWSLRPWILMRELGIAFEEKLIPFPSTNAFEAFRPISPTGRVPALHDGDLVVWDSLAIAEYLAERHPGVWPSDAKARAFARSAAAEMHSGFSTLRTTCGMNCGLRVRLGPMSAQLTKDVARISELWNEGLRRFGGPFLAGPIFTNVDAFFAPVAYRAQTYGLPFEGAAAEYVQRLLALPGMQSWYAAALVEPWREIGHEEEIIAAGGTVVSDLRTAPKI